MQAYARHAGQRSEIGKIGYVGKPHHGYIGLVRLKHSGRIDHYLQGHTVFGINFDMSVVMHQTQDRNAGFAFDIFNAVPEQIRIPAKPVNDKSPDAFSVLRRNHCKGTDQLCKYASPVDVRHQDHGSVRHMSHPEINEIPAPQVHFRAGSGPFHNDQFVVGPQPGQTLPGLAEKVIRIGEIFGRFAGACGPAVYNNLGTCVGRRFQKYRIHVDIYGNPCCFRLNDLCPADFPAGNGNVGVVGHVLSLERCYAIAPV